VYRKARTYAYQIGKFTIERHGVLVCDDEAALDDLLRELAEKGFTADEEPQAAAVNASDESSGLTITLPNTAATVGSLTNLLEIKGMLIKKTLDIKDSSIKVYEVKICFPWFPKMPPADEPKTYTEFNAAMCRMSKKQRHIRAAERPADKEKFTLRVS